MVDFYPVELVPIFGAAIMIGVIWQVCKLPGAITDTSSPLDESDYRSPRTRGGNLKSKRNNHK